MDLPVEVLPPMDGEISAAQGVVRPGDNNAFWQVLQNVGSLQ